jgi:hypothetical protein
MTAPYGFKFAHTFDGSGTSAVKILPVSSPGTGGIAVGDPVTITSGSAVCAKGADSVYGVVCGIGKTTGGSQSVAQGGSLVNAIDPFVQTLGSSDTGFVAVIPADNAVFRTVYLGTSESGAAITRAASLGSAVDIGNGVSGSAATYDALAAHTSGASSKLGATIDGGSPNSELIIQGFSAIGGTLSTRSSPVTYTSAITGNITAGDEIFVTFVNVQHNPV